MHGKSQAIGLPGTVVGILAQDRDFNFGERDQFKGAKNRFLWRIDDPSLPQRFDASEQIAMITLPHQRYARFPTPHLHTSLERGAKRLLYQSQADISARNSAANPICSASSALSI